MYKTWNVVDEVAKAEGTAITLHNELRVICKTYRRILRPDITVLEVYVRSKTCSPPINLRKHAASEKHKAILARLRNPALYAQLRQ